MFVLSASLLAILKTINVHFIFNWIFRERETPPRFAQPGSFEYEYSQRWKSLDEMEKQQRDQVEKNMKDAKDKLESEMEDAYHEHQANLLRQGIGHRPLTEILLAFSHFFSSFLSLIVLRCCFRKRLC